MNEPAIEEKYGNQETGYTIKPGVFADIPDTEYHASPGISKHGLDLIARSPAHYKHFSIEQTPALAFGSAFHAYVLEPLKFRRNFSVAIYDDFRTKVAREWKQAMIEQGVTIISQQDFRTIEAMATVLRANENAARLLNLDHGRAENSAYWVDANRNIWKHETPTFRLCRCRPDFINDKLRVVVDLKTTLCAGYSAFVRDTVKYRYHVQDAFYVDGLRQCGERVDAFVFVCIEKAPPYGLGLYELSKPDRELGRQLYQRDLLRYHDCMTDKKWPGYDEEIRVVDLPPWASKTDIF